MHKGITTIISLMILIFSGCSKFSPKRMIKQKEAVIGATTENQHLSAQIKLLSQTERSNHFNHFKVLQCRLKNKTNQPVTLDQSSFNLPVASAQEVQKKEPKIYTAYFIPAIISTISAYFFLYQLALPLAAGCSLLAAHASGKTNSSNSKHLKKLALFSGDSILIKPKSSKTFLLFIPKLSYKPEFKLSLAFENNITTELTVEMQTTTESLFLVQG